MMRRGHGARLQLGALGRPRISTSTVAPWRTSAAASDDAEPMDFVLTLHSHLPYVLNHGRWPHGSDWLCEAAVDTYLPLLEVLAAPRRRRSRRRRSPSASRRCSPTSSRSRSSCTELEAFFEQRLAACDEAPASLAATGEAHLLPLVEFWRDRLLRLPRRFRRDRRRPDRRVPRPRGRGPARDHRLGRDPRLPAAARPRREHPAPARRRHRRAPPPVRPGARRVLAAGVRLPAAGTVGSRGPTAPRSGIAGGHRGAPGRRRVPLLLRRLPPGGGRPPARALRRSRRRPDRAGRRRGRAGRRRRAALALPRLSRGSRARRGRRRRRSCATRARRCRSGAGSGLSRRRSATSSSTRSAGPAASSSGG